MPLTDDQIRALYADPATGLKGLPAFIQQLKGQASAAQVRRALLADETWSLNARREHPHERRRVVVHGLDDTWTADLADVSSHAQDNDGVRYILVVVDVFSKHAWAEPMKTKEARTAAQAFRAVLARAAPRIPTHLWTDAGSEFKGAFDALCRQRGIQRYTTQNEGKAVIAERFIRTLRGRLGRLADATGSWRWVDALQTLVGNYNGTPSRTHGLAPSAVNADNARAVAERLYGQSDDRRAVEQAAALSARPRFKVGDLVHISALKSLFAKEGTTHHWSRELYRVIGVASGPPVRYRLADVAVGDTLEADEPLEGEFYEAELSPAAPPSTYKVERVVQRRTRAGRQEALVKWLGWPDKYNQWVPADSVK